MQEFAQENSEEWLGVRNVEKDLQVPEFHIFYRIYARRSVR